MLDITKLRIGDIFYLVIGYDLLAKMEVLHDYNPENNILNAKYLEVKCLLHPEEEIMPEMVGEIEWLNPNEEGNEHEDEGEKYYDTYEEAEKAFREAEVKRLAYLTDINNLLDEMYNEINDQHSNHIRLYAEAIKRFKNKQ